MTTKKKINRAWLAVWSQERRRKRKLPAPVLVAQYPSLAVWEWDLPNPFHWNAYRSLDGGVSYQFDDFVNGSARQYAPDGGTEFMFIVGVDADGKEITAHSNPIRPDDAVSELPDVPAVNDLVVLSRSIDGFQMHFTAVEGVVYRCDWRIHGASIWNTIGTVVPDFALNVPEATEHSFDVKVVGHGDDVIYSARYIDSNICETVNDLALDDAPAINDLNVESVGAGQVNAQWSSLGPGGIAFISFYRETPAGEWIDGPFGEMTDGAATFVGLSNGVEYEFKLQTFGLADQSLYKIVSRIDSNLITATPVAFPAPDAPTIDFIDGNLQITSSLSGVSIVRYYFTNGEDPFAAVLDLAPGSSVINPCDYNGNGFWKATVIGDDAIYSGESDLSDWAEVDGCG